MKKSTDIGQDGEELAAKYLRQKGYHIIQRNFRSGRMEIDLIVENEECLVFVEVKSRASSRFGFPEEGLGAQQEERIRQASQDYLLQVENPKRIRFDIIAILWGPPVEIKHFEDAF